MRVRRIALFVVLVLIALQLVTGTAVAGGRTVQFSSATYSADEDAGTVEITVTLSSAVGFGSFSIDYASSGTDASNDGCDFGGDYEQATGTLTFSGPVTTSKTFDVELCDDSTIEGDETFLITLTNPSPSSTASLGSPATTTVTIEDDDPVYSFASSTYTVDEAAGTVTATITRPTTASSSQTVFYSTQNISGQATPGSDYTSTAPTAVTFSAPQTSRTVSIAIVNDSTAESSETFNIVLSQGSGGSIGSPSTTTVTITDDDTVAQSFAFSSSTYTVAEDGGTVTVTVNRSGTISGSVSVSYATSNGTATASPDYIAKSGTLNFSSSETSETFNVTMTNDTTAESSETFTVTLSSPSSGTSLGSPSSATVTITDDDTASAQTVAFSSSSASVGESNGSVDLTVARSGGTTGTLTVAYSTSAGTATAGTDYTSASDTLTFTDGQSSKTITVAIASDTMTESNETFTVTLSSPTGGSLGSPSTSTVTITDDDGTTAVLGFSSSAYSVDEDGVSATITVTRSGSASGSKSVDYTTSDGTATAGSDYTTAAGTLTFAGSDTSKTFDVLVSDDSSVESDETVTLTLSGPTGGAELGTSTATLTIGDDDSVATVVHDRSVSLRLKRHLVAKGTVTVPDGTGGCYKKVTVKIQKKKSGTWKTIDRTVTDNQGDYRTSIPDKTGRYRAKVPKITLNNGDTCSSDKSGTKRHRH